VPVTCQKTAFSKTIAFWRWKRSVPPTDPQFEWFERHYDCRESEVKGSKGRGAKEDDSAPETQGLKRVREFYRKQYEGWIKDRDSAKEPPQSFTDRIPALLAKEDGGRSRHRREGRDRLPRAPLRPPNSVCGREACAAGVSLWRTLCCP
jgi:hypothetical protein